ncbi:coiled-coil domain-containing protein 96 [Gavia stellata]|uniref:coiled-coil domain-containing protein 96 n=1 Tax=Gavia stellata TaxID=37040 RepID=UPI0028A18F3B|nr:coiled-coil domain-containing protein 96 [Gavia stellata]
MDEEGLALLLDTRPMGPMRLGARVIKTNERLGLVLGGAGEPAEPRPEVPAGPRSEEPPGPCEPEKLGLEESEPPGPEEPPEPEVAAGLPGPPAAAPAAGGAEEEAASGGDGAAGQAPPAARAEGAPGPLAPAAPGGAERRSGEEAGEAPEERDGAEEGAEERRERAALLEQHRGLAGERERLRQASARLQLRLGELLRLRRGERRPRAELGAGGPQLYGQRLRRLRELREQRERAAAACRERVAARRRGGEERQAQAQAEWAAFQARKKAVAVFSLGRRLGGREAAAEAVDRIQARERDKEQQVREARVENIKLKHEIQTLETILKAQGELVDSQHFMDLEDMKKENQKRSEKIGDLSDEILKLKKKVSNAVHILSQFKEKLQFVEAENQGRKVELMDIEIILSQKRDVLTKSKQARDRLQRNNLKLQQKRGLLGNEILLRDFEEMVGSVELLSQRLETLKHHHARLILTCRGIQKKIKEANSSFLAEDG